jgi:hypothetical protein
LFSDLTDEPKAAEQFVIGMVWLLNLAPPLLKEPYAIEAANKKADNARGGQASMVRLVCL